MKKRFFIGWGITGILLTGPAGAAMSEQAQQRFQQGLAYERLGRVEQAYTELQLAHTLDARDAPASLALGVVALRLQRFDVAQRSLENSIALDPGSVASYYVLAMLYEHQHLPERALDMWQRFSGLSNDPVLLDAAKRHIAFLQP